MSLSNNYTTFRGDDFALNCRIKSNLNPINITGWTIFFTLKEDINDTDENAIIQKTITTHTDAVNGLSRVVLTSAETDNLLGDYEYDIQYKTDIGIIKTIIAGTITFRQDVTRRTN